MKHFFKDLKVIELAGVLAGPGVGYFFAELGAKVIKVENPRTHGDVTRSWKLKTEDPKDDTSSYFWSVNAFKEFIEIDLEKDHELKNLYELIKDADIVITNYKAGDEKKLKVDYKTLSAINPRLIYGSISGFGTESSRIAFDLILQAESGFMTMNGEPNTSGLKMPVALIDVLAGHQLKEAFLIALLERYKTNKGCHLSVSLFDSAVASLVNQATNWLIGKQLPKPSGSLHPNIAPYGEVFETKDKQLVTFAIGSNKQFKALAEILQMGALASDAKYATNHSRVNNRTQLYSLLYNYIHQLRYADLASLCLEKGIPMGKLRNLKEVFELPEAQALLRSFTHKGKKLTTVSSLAFKFHGSDER